MTPADYRALEDLILSWEGRAFSNHPADPGKATKYGITAATLGAWRRLERAATPAEVQALTEDEARAIYRANYIDGPRFRLIPDPALRACVVDFGVNGGADRAAWYLQKAAGVTPDMRIGPATVAAVTSLDPLYLRAKITNGRLRLIARWMRAKPERATFTGLIDRAASHLPAFDLAPAERTAA